MKSKRVWMLWGVTVIAVIICASGLACVAASFTSFEWAKVRADRLTVDGTADFFTPEFFGRLVLRARVAGVLALLSGSALFRVRGRAARKIALLFRAIVVSAREGITRLLAFLREGDRLHLAALGIIVFCAVLVRLAFLAQPMRYDETYTYLRYAAKPLYIAISDYSAPNNHVFHTLLVHLSTRLFGGSPWAIRLPALLAGIALAPAAYLLGRVLYGRHVALLAAALVGASSALVEFSVNARGYTLMALVFLLSLALATALRRSNNPAAWALFAVLSALGFYTVPVMLYPFGVVVLWLGLSAACGDASIGRRRLFRSVCVAILSTLALTAVLYLPVLLASGPAALAGNPFLASKNWADLLASTWDELRLTWDQWNRDLPVALVFVLLAGFLMAVARHGKIGRQRVPVLIAVVFWCVLLVLIQRAVVFRRVWLFLLPWYLTTAAAGVAYVLGWIASKMTPVEENASGRSAGQVASLPCRTTRWPAILAIVLCLGLSLNVWRMQSVPASDETEAVRDAPAMARFFQQILQPDDRVLAPDPASTVLEYYLSSYGVPVEYLVADLRSSRRIFIVVQRSTDRPRQSLEEQLGGAGLAASASAVRLVERYDEASVYELDR